MNVGKRDEMHCILLSSEKKLNKETKASITEAMKGTIVKHNRNVKVCPMNEGTVAIESMRVSLFHAACFFNHELSKSEKINESNNKR